MRMALVFASRPPERRTCLPFRSKTVPALNSVTVPAKVPKAVSAFGVVVRLSASVSGT